MQNKFLLYICFILYIHTNAQQQVLPEYPKNQVFYKGGYEKFYEEAHRYLVKNNVAPCDNPSEVLVFRIIVSSDGSVQYVKDDDTAALENNKCAFSLGKKVLGTLKDYTPAEVNGKKVGALTRIIFAPNDLFRDSNWMPDQDQFLPPEFPGGITEYRRKFASCLDVSSFGFNSSIRFQITFDVDTQGEIGNIFVDTNFQNPQFEKMIVDCVGNIRKKFKPATYKGTPLNAPFRLPVFINVR